MLVGLLVYPVKALRWRVILGREQTARYRPLLSAVMIGFMANCIVSRLGELIRAAVMSIKGEMRTSTAMASIALERVFDMCHRRVVPDPGAPMAGTVLHERGQRGDAEHA